MTSEARRVLDEMAAEAKAKAERGAEEAETQRRIAALSPADRAEFERRLKAQEPRWYVFASGAVVASIVAWLFHTMPPIGGFYPMGVILDASAQLFSLLAGIIAVLSGIAAAVLWWRGPTDTASKTLGDPA